MEKEKIKTPSIENLSEFLKTHEIYSWEFTPLPNITAFELYAWIMLCWDGKAEHLGISKREDWLNYCPSILNHVNPTWKKRDICSSFSEKSSSTLRRICNFLKFGK